MDTKERTTPTQSAHARIMKPWGIQTTTAGDRIDTRGLSEHTLVLEVTAHYDGKETKAVTVMSHDSARALRDNLNTFLGE